MGCLHEGHLALIRKAKTLSARCVVSIFVNPLQFGPKEDLVNYPRPIEEDKKKLEAGGVDVLFLPTVEELYPNGFQTKVGVGSLADALCGEFRPGHFEGVATVCLKLFNASLADLAVFGKKDFQQLRILEQMVGDLNAPVQLIRHDTVREEDGLAMSSRNRYLSVEERPRARAISQSLLHARTVTLKSPDITAGEILGPARSEIEKAGLQIQYLSIASAQSLRPVLDANLKIHTLQEPRPVS